MGWSLLLLFVSIVLLIRIFILKLIRWIKKFIQWINVRNRRRGQIIFGTQTGNITFFFNSKVRKSKPYLLEKNSAICFKLRPGKYDCSYTDQQTGKGGRLLITLKDKDILKIKLPLKTAHSKSAVDLLSSGLL
jgi:hypothetical protein